MSHRPLSDILKDLRIHVSRHGYTQEFLADQVGFSQGTISRALANEPKRLSRCLKALCEYAKIPLNENLRGDVARTLPPNLMRAMQEVWNGELEQADALANMLRGVKALMRPGENPELE